MYNQDPQGYYETIFYQEPYYQAPVRTQQIHRNTIWILALLVLIIVLGYFFYQKTQANHSETMFTLQDIKEGLPKIMKFDRG